MPVRTTRLQNDGASRRTSQGLGLPVAPGARPRPQRMGPAFSSFMGQDAASSKRLSAEIAGVHEGDSTFPSRRRSPAAADTDAVLDRETGEPKARGKAGEGSVTDDPLDPLCRALASGLDWQALALSTTVKPEVAAEPVDAAARVSLEQVLDQLVRKIAWSGDARAGTARVELGAGALAGAVLLVQADGPEVRITLEVPPGADAASWRDRIERRLSSRGLRIAELEVR